MSATESKRPIGDILVEKGLITADQLAAALEEQGRTGGLLGEILVERGFIERLALAGALGSQWGGSLTGPRNRRLSERPSPGEELSLLRAEVDDLRLTVTRLEASNKGLDERLTVLAQLVLRSEF
jgi:hypothetical protein